ncbi:MAG: DUF3526 domain-containing protein [Pseudomonadota bacterium]
MSAGILYHERLNFVVRGPALPAVLLIVLAIFYAGWSGDGWRDARVGSLEAFEADRLEALGEWRDELQAIEEGSAEPSPYAANPMGISFPAVLPPSSLADFAVGHADLHPASGEISTWRNLSSVFGRYQFDNPSTLAASAFDVALVIVLLMPVLMIAVSFDVLAGERSRGSLAMVLASPLRLPRLVWTRLLFRNGILWLAATLAMFALVLVNDTGGDRYARFAIWLGISLAYGLFWLAAIAYCVARFRSATNTAAAMVGLWLLLVLAVPAAIATLAEAAYPTPSRLAFLSEVREAQGETNRNLAKLTEGFLMDHPELSVGDDAVPAFYRAAFLSNQAARENTRPIVEAYEAARAGRAQTLRFAQYLSPSIIAQRLLVASAGADLDRQHRFQGQAREALDRLAAAIGPAVVSRNRLPLDEFHTLQPFAFEDRTAAEIAAEATAPLVFLLVLSLIAGTLAHRRLGTAALHD